MSDGSTPNVVIFAPSIKFIVAIYTAEIVAGFLILLYLLSRGAA